MSYQNVTIPEELAHRLRQVFRLSELPQTLGDLAAFTEAGLGPFTAGGQSVSSLPRPHAIKRASAVKLSIHSA